MGILRTDSANQNERTRDFLSWLDDPGVFESCTFNGFVDASSLKFDAAGSMTVRLTIPPGQVENALSLRHLLRDHIPLTVTITALDEFNQLVTQQSERTEMAS